MNKCLHIQTYSSHFSYCNELVYNIRKYNQDLPIYIVLDNHVEYEKFKEYKMPLNVIIICLEDIVSNTNLRTINFNDICLSKINMYKLNQNDKVKHFNYYRQYVVLKRVYSLLYLYTLGYNYIWALDCESYQIKKIDTSEILERYFEDPFIVVASDGTEYDRNLTQKVNNIFKYDQNISCNYFYRQNDFFIYNMKIFEDCMKYIEHVNNSRICDFMVAPEQMVYEIYCIRNNLNFKIIDIGVKYNCTNMRYGGIVKNINRNKDNLIKLIKDYMFCLWGDIVNDLNGNLDLLEHVYVVVSNCPRNLISNYS